MKISAETKERIYALYSSGETAPRIAKMLGVGSTTVYRTIKERGIAARSLNRRGQRGHANRKFTDDMERQIADDYQSVRSTSVLAERYGCNARTIANVLRRQGVEVNRRGNVVREFTPDQMADIYARWQAGESQTKIAEAYGTHQTVVSRALRMHGLTPVTRHARRESHGNWGGGRTTARGYVMISVDHNSPFAPMRNIGGYVMEHRLVMAQYLGRSLEQWESVHHINGIHNDNRLENLQLRIGKHGKHVAYRCMDCGSNRIEPIELLGA